MTALKDLSQNSPVVEAGIDDLALTTRKSSFDTQMDFGATGAGLSAAASDEHELQKVISGTASRLEIVYTPDEDVWWEVVGHVERFEKGDAAWHWAELTAVCEPAPEIGPEAPHADIIAQYNGSGGCVYHHREISAMWGLAANTEYTAYLKIEHNGGTWYYTRDPEHLWLYGKGWGR